MGISFARITVQNAQPNAGANTFTVSLSVAEPVTAPPTATDTITQWLSAGVDRGGSSIPNLVSATSPAGAVIVYPTFPTTLDIVLLVLIGAALLGLLVMIIIICVRRGKHASARPSVLYDSGPSKRDSLMHNRYNEHAMDNYRDNHDFYPAASEPAASAHELRFRVTRGVEVDLSSESGQHCLAVVEGDRVRQRGLCVRFLTPCFCAAHQVMILQSDWTRDAGPWVWAQSLREGISGYVPRVALERIV